MAKILIYKDEGVHPLSYRQLRRFLRRLGHDCSQINASQVIEEEWENDADIFAIGGGADVPYHKKLSGKGTSKIARFVESGGCYLGICAGSYFGCSDIDFDRGGQLEVIEKRDLAFFPGTAVGPAYQKPSYDPHSSASARVAPIHWFEETTLPIFFNGGCYFRNAHLSSSVEILARYVDLPGQPASAVRCSVGKGNAILCGTHPEYDADLLPKEMQLSGVHQTLEFSTEHRKKLFSRMLGEKYTLKEAQFL